MKSSTLSLRTLRDENSKGSRDKTFDVRLGDTKFGLFWVGEEGSSLRWPGGSPFEVFARDAVANLPRFVPGDNALSGHATLCLSDGSVIELTRGHNLLRWTGIRRKHPARVVFARFDWNELSSKQFSVAFTADEGGEKAEDDSEFGVLLPNAGWSPSLISWIVGHHAKKSTIRPRIDIESSSLELQKARKLISSIPAPVAEEF